MVRTEEENALVYRPNYQNPTGEKKRSTIWWYEFVYRSQRIRRGRSPASKLPGKLSGSGRHSMQVSRLATYRNHDTCRARSARVNDEIVGWACVQPDSRTLHRYPNERQAGCRRGAQLRHGFKQRPQEVPKVAQNSAMKQTSTGKINLTAIN